MAIKKQNISELLDAIAHIKSYKNQDSKKNPILSEALNKMEKDLFEQLYEAENQQFKKNIKNSTVKSVG